MTKGGKNLIILGIASAVVAIATTSVSLAIYHDSGDIYLDRSRPGYLPDEAEAKEEAIEEEEYVLEKSGRVTTELIDEYLEKLEVEIKAVDAYESPFDVRALSDEKFGIANE